MFIIRNARVFRQFKQSNESLEERYKLVRVVTTKQVRGLCQQFGDANCGDLFLCDSGDLLNCSILHYQRVAHHSKHSRLNTVDHLNQGGATVLDDKHEEEDQETLDVLGGFGGGESLEEDDEDLLEKVGERVWREMFHHGLEQVETLVIIVLAVKNKNIYLTEETIIIYLAISFWKTPSNPEI